MKAKPDLNPVRRLYAEPDAISLLSALPNIAHRLQADLEALQGDPSPTRCDGVAQGLYGAQVHVQRLQTALHRNGCRNEQLDNHPHEKAHAANVG